MPTVLGLLLAVVLGTVRAAHAQLAQGGTITDPPATFTRPLSAFDTSPAARFTGVSADPMENHVFEMGWWYRLAGGDREKVFPNPTTEAYVADTSTVVWDVIDAAFSAVETGVVTNGGGPSGQVVFSLTVTNPSSTTPLTIDVFNMTDVDLAGTTEGDVGTLLVANERIGITDGATTAEYGGQGADAFLVMTAQNSSGLPDVAARLSDIVVDNFDNSGLPFGPEDISTGFQWANRVIPPSGSATFVVGIAVNMPLTLPAEGATTTTITTATTSTTLTADVCNNCVDDDGDGLVDFEDGDCCAAAESLSLGKSRIRARGESAATLKLRAKLGPATATTTPDLTIQLRGTDTSFCARIPAASLVRRGKRLLFRDADGTLPGAGGLSAVTVVEKAAGAKVAVSGRAAALVVPAPGTLTVTLGFDRLDAADRCAAATATFRAARRGIRFP